MSWKCHLNGYNEVSKDQQDDFATDPQVHQMIQQLPVSPWDQSPNQDLTSVLAAGDMDINALNSDGDTPLIHALKSSKRGMVKALLDAGCDINKEDKFGKTILIFATQHNYEDVVNHLLEHYRKILKINMYDFSNYTALCYAVASRNLSLCQILLDAGADPNISNISPLYLAIRGNCDLVFIKMLIGKGAFVDFKVDFTGFNLLMASVLKDREDIVKILLEHGITSLKTWFMNRAFMAALEQDKMSILHVFLEKGMEICCLNYKQSNVLHEVATHDSPNMVTYILQNTKLDVDARDANGKTAFYLAAQKGNIKCLKLLYAAGANGRVPDVREMMALESAVLNNQPKSVEFILRNNVYSSSVLFYWYRKFVEDYGKFVMGNRGAFTAFKNFMSKRDPENMVDSLCYLCLLEVRTSVGQRIATRADELELPVHLRLRLVSVNDVCY